MSIGQIGQEVDRLLGHKYLNPDMCVFWGRVLWIKMEKGDRNKEEGISEG